jgi:hypothetical protein
MTKLEKCEFLKERGYTYDSETGKIYGVRGTEITRKDEGYIVICGNKNFKGSLRGHHFAWYMTYGNVDFEQLDHINRIKDDNRICNLRVATHQQNQWNNDCKGYSWSKELKKWKARIKINHQEIYLGLFNTEDDARDAYLQAKEKLHNF